MRELFRTFKIKQLNDSANDKSVEETTKKLEIRALNSTLDDIVLEISVQKQEGASSQNISEVIRVENLKEFVTKNAHGLYEIKLDTK